MMNEVRRRRGRSPSQITPLVRNPQRTLESGALTNLLIANRLLRVNGEPGGAAYDYNDLIGVIWGHLAPDSWNGTAAIDGICRSFCRAITPRIADQLRASPFSRRRLTSYRPQAMNGPRIGKPAAAGNVHQICPLAVSA